MRANQKVTSMEDTSMPINVDSNGEEVAYTDNRDAMKTPAFQIGAYKPTADGKPPKRQRKLTSTVWEHYQFLEPDEYGNLFCKCKNCGQIYPGDSKYGTGNLKRHLDHCKKRCFRDIGQLLMDSRSGSLVNRRAEFDAEVFRRMMATCIVKHDLPLQFCEYDGMKELFSYLNPDVKVFSRRTTKNAVMKLFTCEKEKIKQVLESYGGRVSFTSDCWTSVNTDGYITLTAHYIDSSWSLRKKILNFAFLPPPHNGVAIAEKIRFLLKDWGIDKKVMCLTVDNASSNDVCVDMLKTQLKLVCDGEYFHVRCCAHILNLIVKEGLKEMDDVVFKVRECVKYCKGSQARKQRLLESVRMCDLVYTKGLRQDVPTRWNSIFLMLESALHYKKVFKHLEVVDENFVHCPRHDEWAKIEKLCGFLKVFYEVTCAFSGSKYPTSNLYFSNVVRVRLVLKEEMENEDSFIKSMATRMFAKFEKYWAEFSTIMAISTILDPRYKFQFAVWAYRRIYGDSHEIELSLLKDKLFALFDEYANSSNSSCSTTTKSCSTSKASSVEARSDPLWEDFDHYSSSVFKSAAKSDLELYLDENKLPRVENYDVLGYWSDNKSRFPILSQMAGDILAIPLSTVASESAFSVGGRVLDVYRSSLAPQTVESIICLRDWLYGQELMPAELNLEDLCGDAMKTNLNEDEVKSASSKSEIGSGIGQK